MKYKIKLLNDRVIGPFTLGQVKQLYLKGKINLEVSLQEFPGGDWKDLNKFPNVLYEITIC